ncbi:hypothetical protein BOO69_17380 [Sulfitobacter alexandrii]|uniref:Uncharacterized protein n=1 Tax=Sulfitobacter alexandrii TaxID=1917485 RepID=A0A1J0WL14_9RHOB|nr:hypothetical protein BOO69_17380 [Sulfitobacter alexandrii]
MRLRSNLLRLSWRRLPLRRMSMGRRQAVGLRGHFGRVYAGPFGGRYGERKRGMVRHRVYGLLGRFFA